VGTDGRPVTTGCASMIAIALHGLQTGQLASLPLLVHPGAESADLPAGFAEGSLQDAVWSSCARSSPVRKIVADQPHRHVEESRRAEEDDGEHSRSLAAS